MNESDKYTLQELMSILIARDIKDKENIGIGVLSPIPTAGCWLAREMHAPNMNLTLLNTFDTPYNEGTGEFFDAVQKGDCDLFFFSGAQIDKKANINLHVIGDYYKPKVRLPGGAGSGMIYYMAKRTILFLSDHSQQKLVEKVDFITSPGSSEPEITRNGGPSILITPLCVMRFNSDKKELELDTIHPGIEPADVVKSTGWNLSLDNVGTTVPPTKEELTALRTIVRNKLFNVYPDFTKKYVLEV